MLNAPTNENPRRQVAGGPVEESSATELWRDMRQQWDAGKTPGAESYLEALGQDDTNERLVLDLVYAEFVLSREVGRPLRVEELCERFPKHAAAIRRQLEVHQALSSIAEEESPDKTRMASGAEALPWNPGDFLGRYYLVEKLGVGGQSEVFKAIHPDLGVEVVLKVGRVARSAGPDEHLQSEARLLGQLDHPNLVRVFDLTYLDEHPVLVMQYEAGRTLSQWAADKRPTPREAAALVAKVSRAVAAAHAHGVVHRDIKPDNILVDPRGEPKLIDFGLSRTRSAWSGDPGRSAALSGTLPYMAPEQARDADGASDPRSDVFSLGAVLYFLLTGQRLYAEPDFNGLYRMACSGQWRREPLDDSGVDRGLRRRCAAALAPDPDERTPSAEALANELDRYANRPRGSRKVALGAAGLLALAVLTAWAAPWGQPPPAGPSPGGQLSSSSTPAVLSPSLRVELLESGRWLDVVECGGARTGDRLRIHVNTGPATLYLFSSEGAVERLARFQASPDETSLTYPAGESESVPLVGEPGAEVLLVCYGSAAPSVEQLSGLFGATPWPALPEATILRLDQAGVHWESRSRGLGKPESTETAGQAVYDRLERVGQALAESPIAFEALAFPHLPAIGRAPLSKP